MRYRCKLIFNLLIVFAAFVFIIPVFVLNLFFAFQREHIEAYASSLLRHSISVKSVYYVPFRGMVLTDVDAGPADDAAAVFLHIPSVTINVSLRELATQGGGGTPKVILNKPVFDFDGVRRNIKKIVDALLLLPRGAITVDISDGWVSSNDIRGRPVYFPVAATVTISENGSIDIRGEFSFLRHDDTSRQDSQRSQELFYEFSGAPDSGRFIIKEAIVRREKTKLRLWGQYKNKMLTLNGASSDVKEVPQDAVRRHIFERITGMFKKKKKPAPAILGVSRMGYNVFDLVCRMRFQEDSLLVDEISCTLGDIPYLITGKVSYHDPATIRVRFASFPERTKQERIRHADSFNIEIKGTMHHETLEGGILLEFPYRTTNETYFLEINSSIKGVNVVLPKDAIKIRFDDARITATVKERPHVVLMKEGALTIIPQEKGKFDVTFDSGVYDGALKAAGTVDMQKFPPDVRLDLDINRVDAQNLEGLLEYFSKITGVFDSRIRYESRPHNNLNGTIIITDGTLEDFQFFNWIADFFSIPSLKDISFATISSGFSMNEEGSGLEDILLDSDDVNLTGYFIVTKEERVSGKLSLALSQGILRTSPKFRYILNHLDEEASRVSFNFQMSGLFQKMNFKWLTSDFKQGLEDFLPARYERAIEKGIEKAVESTSAQDEKTPPQQNFK